MFIESCEVQLSSAIVGIYDTLSHPVFAETCTEHEHTTDTQNEKRKNISRVCVLFFWEVFLFFFLPRFAFSDPKRYSLSKIKVKKNNRCNTSERKRRSKEIEIVLQSRVNVAVKEKKTTMLVGCRLPSTENKCLLHP